MMFSQARPGGRAEGIFAEYVFHSLFQAVKALGAGIGVVRTEHGGDLVVAHRVDAGIRQHVQINVIRAELEGVETRFPCGFQAALHGNEVQLLDYADLVQFQRNLLSIVKFDRVGCF